MSLKHPITGLIYLLRNKTSDKVYVGQTSGSVRNRIYHHKKDNSVIGRALRKHGIDNFHVTVIDKAISRSALHVKERKWIKFYKANSVHGYNCTAGGDGCRNMKHTIAARRKIGAAHLGVSLTVAHRRAIGLGHVGKKRSAETCSRISAAKLGVPRPDLSARNQSLKNRKKVSLALKGHVAFNLGMKFGPCPKERRTRISEKQKANWQSKRYRKHMSKVLSAAQVLRWQRERAKRALA